MDEETEHKPSVRLEIAEFFSNKSRSAGKVTFKITYTNTDGNRDIDQRFQDFCFKYSNNEYLGGIGLLLDAYAQLRDRQAMEAYMKYLEQRLIVLEDKVLKEVEPQEKLHKEDSGNLKEYKTF